MTMTLTWWHRSCLPTDRNEQNAGGKYTKSPPHSNDSVDSTLPSHSFGSFSNPEKSERNIVAVCSACALAVCRISIVKIPCKWQSSRKSNQNKTQRRKRKSTRAIGRQDIVFFFLSNKTANKATTHIFINLLKSVWGERWLQRWWKYIIKLKEIEAS